MYPVSLLLVLLQCFNLSTGAILPSIRSANEVPDQFDWLSITPAEDLVWSPCYSKYECARLLVPLDWKHNTSNPDQIALAVIRLPAKVPRSDSRHEGTVIINPGGPGGSGVGFALWAAKMIQDNLDDADHRFEILSFDPRGVWYSTPSSHCFGTTFEEQIWFVQKKALGRLKSDGNVHMHWAYHKARSHLCADPDKAGFAHDNLRRHMSTASVARDMLEINERLSQQRAAEISSTLVQTEAFTQQSPLTNAAEGQLSHPRSKIRYLGGSYGTFLGQTFASMFPDNVDRMILDSNVNASDWIGPWNNDMIDYEKARFSFFEFCYFGRKNCSLWRPDDRNPIDIQRRVEELLANLSSMPIILTRNGSATVISNDKVEESFFHSTYQPLEMFPKLADFLNAVLTGQEPTPFWPPDAERPRCLDSKKHVNPESDWLRSEEATMATICADGNDFSSSNISEYISFLRRSESIAPHGAPFFADFRMPCYMYPPSLRPHWRFVGPFGSNNSILFVNNRIDPVTPIIGALQMAPLHGQSVVLEQNTVGHGALFPGGKCSWGYARAYMQQGTLPKHGTVCEPDRLPFRDAAEAEELVSLAQPV